MKWKCSACERNKDNKGKYPDCDRCVNGIITATNEDWLRTLNTVQLAKVFGSMLFEAWKDGLAEEMHDKRFYENLVDFWLKQPHHNE